jgi:hypothetical protein
MVLLFDVRSKILEPNLEKTFFSFSFGGGAQLKSVTCTRLDVVPSRMAKKSR